MKTDHGITCDRQAQVRQLIELGVLVCPASGQKLTIAPPDRLNTEDGTRDYRFLNQIVPMLITDSRLVEEYAKSSERMNREYTPEYLDSQESWLSRLRRRDYRTPESVLALGSIFENLPHDAVCVSIGGGPTRADARLLNLNIGPFPNVDIVADAHQLPFRNESIDALHCEATFEHLQTPTVAAREIHRALKPGARAYICTPFLQPYHGYPHHYQNYTMSGHRKLFEDSGLRILSYGACVGPTYTLRNLISTYIANYLPFPANRIVGALWAPFSLCIAPLDVLIRASPNAHVMASTTFLVAEKV